MDTVLKTIQPVTPKRPAPDATCADCFFWRDGQGNHIGDCHALPQMSAQPATRPACVLFTPRAES